MLTFQTFVSCIFDFYKLTSVSIAWVRYLNWGINRKISSELQLSLFQLAHKTAILRLYGIAILHFFPKIQYCPKILRQDNRSLNAPILPQVSIVAWVVVSSKHNLTDISQSCGNVSITMLKCYNWDIDAILTWHSDPM